MDTTLHLHTLTNISTTPATQAAQPVRPALCDRHPAIESGTALARTGQNMAGQYRNQDGHGSARLWSSEQASKPRTSYCKPMPTHVRARPDGTPGRMLSGGRECSS